MTEEESKDLRKKIAELIIVRISGYHEDEQRNYPRWEVNNEELKTLIREGLGGVIILGGSTYELQSRCSELQKLSTKKLLICADVEEGVGQRFHGGTLLPPPMSIGRIYNSNPKKAKSLAEEYGHCIGNEARLNGLNLVLAPICDINNNPENPVINIRAWGSDPLTVSELTCAFHKGIKKEGVLTCAKHFPGHGDTNHDSHLMLPNLKHDLKRLNEIELIPFKSLIESGIDSIMTAHIKLENIDSKNPATLSYTILTELLRNQLNFNGLIVTDALIMEAISKIYGSGEAAVLAIKAGADLILMPEEPFQAIEAIFMAIKKGEISKERIERSILRKQSALQRLSSKELDSRNFQEIRRPGKLLAKEIIRDSLEIQNPGKIGPSSNGINLISVENAINCPFLNRPAPAIVLPKMAGYRSLLIDKNGISPWTGSKNEPLDLDLIGKAPILLQLFLRGNPFDRGMEMQENWINAVIQIQENDLLSGLVIYGSPYLWQKIINITDKNIPIAFSTAQIQEAQTQALRRLIKSEVIRGKNQEASINRFID